MSYENKIRVAGVTFKNEDGVRRQDLLGTLYDDYWTEGREDEIEIELRPEPDNPVDPNAVAIYCGAPEEAAGRLGFVPAEQAPFIGQAIEGGRVRGAEIVEMGCSSKGTVWLRVSAKMLTDGDSPEEASVEEDCVEDEDGRVYEFD